MIFPAAVKAKPEEQRDAGEEAEDGPSPPAQLVMLM